MSFISRSNNGNVCNRGVSSSRGSGNTLYYPGRRSRKFIAGPHARHFLYFDSAISKEERMILFSQIFIFTRALCDFNILANFTPATYLPSEYVEVRIITNPVHPAYGQAGLFAKRNIPNGTIVTPYAGFLEIFNTSCNSRTYTMGFGKYNDDCALDAEFAGNFGRFANDPRGVLGGSANLSAESRYNARGEAFTALVARRQIVKDDEILMSYGKAHSLHPSAWIDVYGKPLLRQREGGVLPVPLTPSLSLEEETNSKETLEWETKALQGSLANDEHACESETTIHREQYVPFNNRIATNDDDDDDDDDDNENVSQYIINKFELSVKSEQEQQQELGIADNNNNDNKARLSVYWECVECGEWNRCEDMTMHKMMYCTQCFTPKLHGSKMVSLLSMMPDNDRMESSNVNALHESNNNESGDKTNSLISHTSLADVRAMVEIKKESTNAHMSEHECAKPFLKLGELIEKHGNCSSSTTELSNTNNENNFYNFKDNKSKEKKKNESHTTSHEASDAISVTNSSRNSVFIPWPMNIMFLPWQVWDPSVPYACVVKHSKFETHERIFLYHVASNNNNVNNNNNYNNNYHTNTTYKRKKDKKNYDNTSTQNFGDSFTSSMEREEFSCSTNSSTNNNDSNGSIVVSTLPKRSILPDNEYESSLSLSLSFSSADDGNDDDEHNNDNDDCDNVNQNKSNNIDTSESVNDDIVSCTGETTLLHKSHKRERSMNMEDVIPNDTMPEIKDEDACTNTSNTTAGVFAACEINCVNELKEIIKPSMSLVSAPSLLSMLLTTTPLEHDRFISIACGSCQQDAHDINSHKYKNVSNNNSSNNSNTVYISRTGHCNHHLYKSIDTLVKGTICTMSRRVFAGTNFASGAVVAYVGGTIRRAMDYRVRPDNSPLVIPMHRLIPAPWRNILQEVNHTQLFEQSQLVPQVSTNTSTLISSFDASNGRECDMSNSPRHFAEVAVEKNLLNIRNDVDFYRRLSELELVVTNEMMYCPCLSIDEVYNNVEHKPVKYYKESRCNSVDDDDDDDDGKRKIQGHSCTCSNEAKIDSNVSTKTTVDKKCNSGQYEIKECENCHTCEECDAIKRVVEDNCNVAFVLTMDGLGSPHVAAVATRAIDAFEALLARTQ